MSKKRVSSKKKSYKRGTENTNAKAQKATTNDIKSKTIFHNPVLCCQFLRDYVDHPLLKDIRPEDIEDYTDRYVTYFGVEFEADTVKRIRLRSANKEISELYLISLIEHKSKVDYNISVQLLKYMACIWAEYEKQFGTEYKDKVKTKEFRYPPILPVVYHEGAGSWTAPMHLKERIFMHEIFEEYIPDFTYCLVNNRDYTNQELLEHKNEMSLIMLLNKIQNAADLSRFLKIPPEEINKIVQESPETVIDIIVMVIQALCTKLNVSKEDTEKCVKKVRTRDMGYLWANMEKIDVQGTYDELVRTRKVLADEKKKVEAEIAKVQAEFAKVQAEFAKVQAESEAEIAKMQAESEAEIAKMQAESEAEIAKMQAESEAEIAKVQAKAENEAKARAEAEAKAEHLAALLKAHGIDVEEHLSILTQ